VDRASRQAAVSDDLAAHEAEGPQASTHIELGRRPDAAGDWRRRKPNTVSRGVGQLIRLTVIETRVNPSGVYRWVSIGTGPSPLPSPGAT
jgi:hypothetical protein